MANLSRSHGLSPGLPLYYLMPYIQTLMETTCPLCNSLQTKSLFNKQGSPFYSCTACTFVFSKPLNNPNFSNTIKDFEPAYLNYLNQQLHDKKNHDALIKKLSRHADIKTSSILDIGCGSGKFVQYLRGKGYDAYGLEPSEALFNNFLKDHGHFYNVDVHAFRQQHPGRQFSIITIADVLEHIEDPQSFIKEVSHLLSPGGVVFISTPDVRSLFARMAGKGWHYYNRYHLSLFSKKTLSQLMESHGFSVLMLKHLTRYQSLYYIIKYGMNFMLRTERGVPRFLSGINVPVNLHDNMYGVFSKTM
jgi:2-polyprenyl-3-methyl-5-hydroxy-6-metoxy-1,4-benzoquinol methylase